MKEWLLAPDLFTIAIGLFDRSLTLLTSVTFLGCSWSSLVRELRPAWPERTSASPLITFFFWKSNSSWKPWPRRFFTLRSMAYMWFCQWTSSSLRCMLSLWWPALRSRFLFLRNAASCRLNSGTTSHCLWEKGWWSFRTPWRDRIWKNTIADALRGPIFECVNLSSPRARVIFNYVFFLWVRLRTQVLFLQRLVFSLRRPNLKRFFGAKVTWTPQPVF